MGGMFLMEGLEASELANVFKQARQNGTITMLDVVTPGPRDYLSDLAKILPETDYFLPNEDEAKLMTGELMPLDQAKDFVI